MSPRHVRILILIPLLALPISRATSDPAAPADTPRRIWARTDSAAIVEVYAAAIRHFNNRVTETQSTAVARPLLYYSITGGLDARFVLATLVVEGQIDRISERKGDLRLNGRPADEALRRITADLAARLKGNAPTGKAEEEPLRAVLRSRARQALHRKRTAEAYVKDVLTTYRQLARRDAANPSP